MPLAGFRREHAVAAQRSEHSRRTIARICSSSRRLGLLRPTLPGVTTGPKPVFATLLTDAKVEEDRLWMHSSETPARRIAGTNWALNCSVPEPAPAEVVASHPARSSPDDIAMMKTKNLKQVLPSY